MVEKFVYCYYIESKVDDSCSIENSEPFVENIKEKNTFSCILEFEDGNQISIPDPVDGWVKIQNISSDTFSCDEIYEGITHFDGKILFKEYFDGNSKVQRFVVKNIIMWKKLPEKEPEIYGALKEYPLLYGIE